MDQLIFKGMRFYGYHGCQAAERTLGQAFTVDLAIDMDMTAACRSDDLKDTIDDEAVFACAREVVEGEPCNLIETVAGRLADKILAEFPAQAVEVTLHKPSAPIPGIFDDFAVIVRRHV